MAACNTETILVRALNGRYARAGDEAYALIREALQTSGDITIRGSVPHIRLDPLSAPRRTRPGRPLRTAQHHPRHLPRHQPHPALRSQRTPRHCGRNGGKPLAGRALERFLPWNASPEDLRTWAQPPPPDKTPAHNDSTGMAAASRHAGTRHALSQDFRILTVNHRG